MKVYNAVHLLFVFPDIAPVWEGTVQHNAVKRFELGGQDVTLFLKKEIERTHPELRLNFSTAQFLKELYGEVAEDQIAYSDTAVDCEPVQHTLPDGQVKWLCDEVTRDILDIFSFSSSFLYLVSMQ
jgi:hypothetical protein